MPRLANYELCFQYIPHHSSSTDYLALYLNPKLLARAIAGATDRSLPCLLHLAVEADAPDTLVLTAECVTRSGLIKSTRHKMGLFTPTGEGDEAFVDGSDFEFTGMQSEVGQQQTGQQATHRKL